MEATTESTAVEREIAIAASPETVWQFLVDPMKATRWMGMTASFDPRPGGAFRLDVIPVDLCVTPAEAAAHPQLLEREAVERGYAKFPVWANGGRGGSIRGATPRLGEHSREILVELGFEDTEIAELRKNRVCP